MTRYRRENHIPKLDTVVRQTIHEVEVEIAQEIRVVLEDQQYYPDCAIVESFKCSRCFLAG